MVAEPRYSSSLNWSLPPKMREELEYGLVVAVARTLGWMPRGLARLLARIIAILVFWAFGRLRRVGVRNLELALPEVPLEARRKILR